MAQLETNYALAMKEISLENGLLKDNQHQVKEIIKLLEENKSFENVLSSAFIDKVEKQNIVDEVFKGQVDKDLLSFFHIIIENNRGNKFLSILKEFNSLCNEYFGIIEGICYSAFELDKSQLNKLEKALSMKQGKEVVLINKVNPELVGGVKIIVGDRVYDSSVSSTIENIKKNLLA